MKQLHSTGKSTQFAIEYAPAKVRGHGLTDAHAFPLVSKGKREGRSFTSWHEEPTKAWTRPQIELRTGNSWPVLVLDLDGSNALVRILEAVDRGRVIRPNWTVTRKKGGGTHAVWTLTVPVHRGADARPGPLRYLARISEYYGQTLEADPGYRGTLTHNPMSHAHGSGFVTNWWQRSPRTLGELGRVIPFGWTKPRVAATAIGRNCSMFDALARWAGSPKHRDLPVLAAAHAINWEIGEELGKPPLDPGEVARIAQSVERRRGHWEREGSFYTAAQRRIWAQVRQARGVASRRKRHGLDERDRAILQDRKMGLSQRAIARKYGLTQARVSQVISLLLR